MKYIIFGKNHYQYNGFDINRYIYHDAIVQENSLYIEPKESFWNRYLRIFYTNEYAVAFRKKLFLPFRKTAFKALLQHSHRIKKQDLNVFVFFYAEPWFFGERGFLAFLRSRYHNARFVYHITNIVQNTQKGPEYYQRCFDLVTTCNKGDSEAYSLPFFPNTCSYIPFRDNKEPDSDCLFIGQAKNRLNDLLTIYETLSKKGIRCEFYINGVSAEDQRFPEEIHYNQPLDYDVVLRKVEKTCVLLELLQEGMDTHTLRYPEAVSYGKKLLTNYANVVNEKSYSPQNIRVISRASDVSMIDASFFQSPIAEEYPEKDSVSSRNFLSFLSNHLNHETK